MKKSKITLLLGTIVLAAILMVGCGKNTGQEKDNLTEDGNQTGAASGDENESDILPEEDLEQEKAGMFEAFETVDLEGNSVTTENLGEHRLTMINIWATWCGPCLNELPELAELAEEYKEEGLVEIKGLLVETDTKTGTVLPGISEDQKELALEILEESGVTYQQLLVSEGMKEQVSEIMGFPTTIFVDENGKTVGKEVLGANSKEKWKEIIEQRLELVNGE